MNPTRRPLLALILYFSVLFSAFACALGHGQLAGLQLSGIDGLSCSASAAVASGERGDFAVAALAAVGGSGCLLCSSFVGVALAAFFGLLGLLPLRQIRPVPALLCATKAVRYLWPSANPRASPLLV